MSDQVGKESVALTTQLFLCETSRPTKGDPDIFAVCEAYEAVQQRQARHCEVGIEADVRPSVGFTAAWLAGDRQVVQHVFGVVPKTSTESNKNLPLVRLLKYGG